jgi:hypothetical protein
LKPTHARLEGESCQLAAALAETVGDRLKAATLLLDSGRRALAQGALAPAETILERARTLAEASSPTVRAEIDEQLLHVLSEAGKQEQVFEVGEVLLRELHRQRGGASSRSRRAPDHRASCCARGTFRGDTRPSGAGTSAGCHGRARAHNAARAAHVAIDERRLADAEQLAAVALAAAERTGEIDVACEALIVLGRLARNYDLDRAEADFERAHQLAEANYLAVWRSRAQHELGTIDVFRESSPRRLLEVRRAGGGLWRPGDRGRCRGRALGRVSDALRDGREPRRRASRLTGGWALSSPRRRVRGTHFQCGSVRATADRTGMERILAELPAAGGQEALLFDYSRADFRGEASLLRGEAKEALELFELAVSLLRHLLGGPPSPASGQGALLGALERRNDGETSSEALPASAGVHPINRAYLHNAAPVRFGRSGLTE